MNPAMNTLLSVQDLSVRFDTARGPVAAVRDLSFTIAAGETVALVGESGSGKSTTAMALMRLLAADGCHIEGRVELQGRELLALPPAGMRQVRGRAIGMIFQDPSVALNPVFTIGDQLIEPLQIHLGLTRRDALERCITLLRLVRVPAPETRIGQYPHNLSGGMRQRVMIAMALACRPTLLIADEPTTALDVTVQAQVLDLIEELKTALGMSVLLITHDLGVVWETASRVVVMYAGRKVEEGPVDTILTNPSHPYTIGLLRAAQWGDGAESAGGQGMTGKPGAAAVQGGTAGRERARLFEIPGTVPSAHAMPPGCAFAPRCAARIDACDRGVPPLVTLSPNHRSACLLAAPLPA